MIYTVGYAGLAPEELLALSVRLDAPIVDVRRSPKSRMRGFGANQIRTLLGSRYVWAGENLGGGQVNERGLDFVRGLQSGILMCLEAAPGDCHRHHDIALPLAREGFAITHVYGHELVCPVELQRAIDADDDYAFTLLSA